MPYFEDKKSFRSWWQSRTGLEQKLVILSTVLFILAFSLMISVIVIKNRSPAAPPAATTVSPVTGTEDTTTVTEKPTPSTSQSPTGESSPSTSQSPTGEPTTPTSEANSTESTISPAGSTASIISSSEAAGSTASTISSSEATGSTETTTITTEPPTENKPAAGSINNRPARYISPRGLANLNGA